ncbi:Glycosyltransferase involved in cell wall bisynthesis [Kordiimonas lacus]|uniref:Glycosyltransferase involved in cell wall bisynthesis n=1 Tax=Kordiimonas lacus TaxID=637679 RepID=A0A1G7F724_9PROT|nr:Glycosyltransferase involved in cell wall bisynthesis [Kordiimonas lacus]
MSPALKKHVKSLLRSVKGDIKALEETGLFQADWYVATYDDVSASGYSPIEHFVRIGEKKGYNPNPYFDQVWYTKRSPAAVRFPAPAAVHYAVNGWRKGRSPSEAFSVPLYLKFNPDVAKAKRDPLRDFLEGGAEKGRIAMPRMFEREKFSSMAADMDLIAKSGLFFADWYKTFHTDLWHQNQDPLMHFIRQGARQGRNPNPCFNTRWYMDTYGDVVGDENPLAFYIRKGAQIGHWPAPDFSPEIYFAENDDIMRDKVDALGHYLHFGLKEKRRLPSPNGSVSISGTEEKSVKLPLPQQLRNMLDFERNVLAPDSPDFDSSNMDIHWVIPDFSAGAGGHMTIFRMAHFLELKGHRQTIWINDPTVHKTAEGAYDDIVKHFQHFAGTVKLLDDSFRDASGDAIIATDCWTVWPTLTPTNFKRRFYFVQDFEPSFHPMGSSYLAAEATYREDIDCICAGPWLSGLMQEKYSRWARHFWLAADQNIYAPPKEPRANTVPRIAFYARHFTARRAVELAMLALEELATRDIEFAVDFFGAKLTFGVAPFPFVDHGVATPRQLADLFQQADVGVVFSATNYSLVPQEMMACGLPIVELKGDNTSCIFPVETVTLAEPDPVKIADSIEALLRDTGKREAQAAAAQEWVSQFSWAASADLVEEALVERLREFGTDTVSDKEKDAALKIRASVVIPTLNAGPILDEVLAAATTQRAPWPYEVLVIDSGSTDETLEIVARYPDVKLHQIDKKDFNHGDTRNLGVELTSGEFIAFLTHDALPANDRWLFNLVTSIEHFPNAAGAFGKHLPWPDACAFTKRDLNGHFDMLGTQPIYLSRDTNRRRFNDKDPQWMQLLHFYSDNNSCMRRSVWKDIPYRPTKFGEDQLWALDVIDAGYGKVYAPQAIVFHSHDFGAEETFERNMTESAFFKHFFGYELIKDETQLEKTLAGINANDSHWGKANGVAPEDIEARHRLNEARLKGYLAGVKADTCSMF